MISFKNFNVNPKNRKTTDCVIRAIATATRQEYDKVVLDLAQMQIKTGYDMSDKKCYEKYLISLGWVKHKQPRKIDGSKYLVGEIDDLVYPHQTAIISLAHHLTVKDFYDIVDIWDCRHKTIGNYYTLIDDEEV